MFPRFEVRVPRKIKDYLKDNPSAPFVLGFQVLLVVCAGLLIQGSPTTAEGVAIYAYFLLMTGVVLQLVSFVRRREESERE